MDAGPDDAYPQRLVDDAVMRSVRADADNLDFENNFLAKPLKDLSLSTLRRLYVNRQSVRAIRLLQDRRRLVVDDDFLLRVHDERVVPSVHGHYVDYILCLGARLGLDAVLPSSTVAVDHTWNADITFSKPFKLWPDTHTKLPFSTARRMLYIGSRRQEDVWLAFPPRSLLDHPNAPPNMSVLSPGAAPSSSDSNHTALSAEHAHMVMFFFAHVLHLMRFQDVVCSVPYPEPVTRESVRRFTGLL